MAFTINSSEKIRLLFVEDDQEDRIAFTQTVKQHSLPYECTLASSLSEALEILRDRTFQIAILDYNLGNGRSSELFAILKEQNCPFVISIDRGDEETAAGLMKEGADDYLIKDPERNYLKILPVTISKTLSRHQTERQLNLLNRAITSVKDSIYILDNQGKLQYINNTLAEFSNISPQEAIGQTIQVLKQPYLEEWVDSLPTCCHESCGIEAEIVMRRADGSNFVALVSETCVIEDHHLIRVGVIRNITSLKSVELKLRHSQQCLENTVNERTAELQQAIVDLQKENQERTTIEESLRANRNQLQQQQGFFRLVIDSIPNLIFVKDWDGHYLFANQAMAEFYNTTVENLVGKTDEEFHPNPIDAERFLQENRQIIETQQELFLPEEKVLYLDLGYQWLQWHKRPIKIYGNTDGVLGVGINITTRKQIEVSLSESQQRFESLAAVAPVGIYRTNTAGDAIYLNDRWCEIAGLTAAEASGPNWARALHPEDREKVGAEWYASVQEHRPFELECRFQKPDGTVTWVLSRANAERDIYGEIIGYVGTITDISDRKRAETILQKLVTGTAAVTGADFFVELVRHIAEALDVTYALVTEVVGGQLVSLGFWANGSLQTAISYLPAKTPCELCMEYGQYHCEEFVQTVFAEDPDLVTMQAESYLGIALKDDDGNVIGNLCVLDTKSMPETKRAEAIGILQVFAARASAELQRKNVNEELNRLNHELEERVLERTQALQEREEQLRDFFDNANDLIQSISPEGNILFVNQAWKSTLGYSEAELENLSIFQIIHPEDLEHCQIAMQNLFCGEQCVAIETRFVTKAGQTIVVEGNVNCQLKDGSPVATRGIFRDITERKKAQKALEESQRLLQTVLDSFPLAVFWKDRQSVLLGSNQYFANSCGLESPLEVIGKTSFDFSFTEDESRKFLEDDQSVMESGLSKIGIEESFTLANGEVNWIETNKIPLRDALGEVIGLVGTFQDISDRKLAEETLAESEAFNRQLVEEFPIGLASCRLDGHLVFVNNVFAQMLGRTVEEILSLSYWDITPTKYAEQESEQLRLIQTEGRYGPYEKEYIHKDGHLVPVLLSGIMILSKGEFLIWSSVQDISDRKQAEAKLQLANEELKRATRLKDEFLANMSHELRTPLNSILGMNESLQDEIFGSINEPQLKALQTIESSSTHLLSLINDILDVAKIESGQVDLDLTATSIESLCKSSLSFINQQALTKRIQLSLIVPQNLSEIMLDERRIRQVLINLLNNAVKFTLEGGTITLEVTQVKPDEGETNLTSPNYLRIAVIDTGIGISSEDIKKLFQPFIQIDSALNRQYTGTGLGLALVKRIVELHGGSVELTSELGVGSCFAITLPFNVENPNLEVKIQYDLAEPSLIDQSQTDNLSSLLPLILLAEDNEANINTFSSYLKAKGYRLVFAKDGQQAIATTKAEHPDLILMDIQMPVIDGLEVIKQIRLDPDLADIPIIALTALAMTGDRERCLDAGANEYLQKPLKLKQLAISIQQLLNAKKNV
ncbi:PAS domain S-box protein [Pseudanabaena minima]|uniref:PAS domain S-box protein n=1 Tax=Pseudanabaena minima TaxID=890415 RepID=UPI003DA9DC3B